MSDAVIVGIIAAVPATIAAVAAARAAYLDRQNFKGIQQIHVRLNGQLDNLFRQLLEARKDINRDR